MKKLFLIFMMIGAMFSVTQARENHFTIGVSTDFTVGDGQEYWGTNITGGYHLSLVKGLYFNPELSLFYHRFDAPGFDLVMPDVSYKHKSYHGVGIGLGVNALVGYRLPTAIPLDFFTGPVLDIAFTQYYTSDRHPEMGYDAAGLFWRFGLCVRICRPITIKAAFDLHITNQYIETNNRFNIGVAYSF